MYDLNCPCCGTTYQSSGAGFCDCCGYEFTDTYISELIATEKKKQKEIQEKIAEEEKERQLLLERKELEQKKKEEAEKKAALEKERQEKKDKIKTELLHAYKMFRNTKITDEECKKCNILPICQAGCKSQRILYGNAQKCHRIKQIQGELINLYYKEYCKTMKGGESDEGNS